MNKNLSRLTRSHAEEMLTIEGCETDTLFGKPDDYSNCIQIEGKN